MEKDKQQEKQQQRNESKKSFFEVKAPLTAAKIMLYSSSAQALDGSIVTLDLTRSLRGKNFVMKFRVKSSGEELFGEPISLELAGSYIRKMIRKGIDYVEDSFITESKDAKIIIKPFMITRNKVSRAIRKDLRNTAKAHIETYLKTRTAKELFTEVMTNKIQKELSIKLKKIYPLALCEIRVFKLVEEKKQI